MEFLDALLDFVSPEIVWGVFFLVAGVYGAVTLALGYHWKEYSVHRTKGRKMIRFYLLLSAVLFFVMLVSAGAYVS